MAGDSTKFFTEPHYQGYPAVLVRLEAVRAADLQKLLAAAWRGRASTDLVRQVAAANPPPNRRS